MRMYQFPNTSIIYLKDTVNRHKNESPAGLATVTSKNNGNVNAKKNFKKYELD
jgi:hypothetical protein